MATLLVKLKDKAIDVLTEISKDGPSQHPVARAIVDFKFGIAALTTTRPQDVEQERTLRLDTPDFLEAAEVLTGLPEVERVACVRKADPFVSALGAFPL